MPETSRFFVQQANKAIWEQFCSQLFMFFLFFLLFLQFPPSSKNMEKKDNPPVRFLTFNPDCSSGDGSHAPHSLLPALKNEILWTKCIIQLYNDKVISLNAAVVRTHNYQALLSVEITIKIVLHDLLFTLQFWLKS